MLVWSFFPFLTLSLHVYRLFSCPPPPPIGWTLHISVVVRMSITCYCVYLSYCFLFWVSTWSLFSLSDLSSDFSLPNSCVALLYSYFMFIWQFLTIVFFLFLFPILLHWWLCEMIKCCLCLWWNMRWYYRDYAAWLDHWVDSPLFTSNQMAVSYGFPVSG